MGCTSSNCGNQHQSNQSSSDHQSQHDLHLHDGSNQLGTVPTSKSANEAAEEFQKAIRSRREAKESSVRKLELEEFDPIRPLDSFNITHRGMLGRCWDRRAVEVIPITQLADFVSKVVYSPTRSASTGQFSSASSRFGKARPSDKIHRSSHWFSVCLVPGKGMAGSSSILNSLQTQSTVGGASEEHWNSQHLRNSLLVSDEDVMAVTHAMDSLANLSMEEREKMFSQFMLRLPRLAGSKNRFVFRLGSETSQDDATRFMRKRGLSPAKGVEVVRWNRVEMVIPTVELIGKAVAKTQCVAVEDEAANLHVSGMMGSPLAGSGTEMSNFAFNLHAGNVNASFNDRLVDPKQHLSSRFDAAFDRTANTTPSNDSFMLNSPAYPPHPSNSPTTTPTRGSFPLDSVLCHAAGVPIGSESAKGTLFVLAVSSFSTSISPFDSAHNGVMVYPVDVDDSNPSAVETYGEGLITSVMYGGVMVVEGSRPAGISHLKDRLAAMDWDKQRGFQHVVAELSEKMKDQAMAEGCSTEYRILRRVGGRSIRDSVELSEICLRFGDDEKAGEDTGTALGGPSAYVSAWVSQDAIVMAIRVWVLHLLSNPEYSQPVSLYLQRFPGIAMSLQPSKVEISSGVLKNSFMNDTMKDIHAAFLLQQQQQQQAAAAADHDPANRMFAPEVILSSPGSSDTDSMPPFSLPPSKLSRGVESASPHSSPGGPFPVAPSLPSSMSSYSSSSPSSASSMSYTNNTTLPTPVAGVAGGGDAEGAAGEGDRKYKKPFGRKSSYRRESAATAAELTVPGARRKGSGAAATKKKQVTPVGKKPAYPAVAVRKTSSVLSHGADHELWTVAMMELRAVQNELKTMESQMAWIEEQRASQQELMDTLSRAFLPTVTAGALLPVLLNVRAAVMYPHELNREELEVPANVDWLPTLAAVLGSPHCQVRKIKVHTTLRLRELPMLGVLAGLLRMGYAGRSLRMLEIQCGRLFSAEAKEWGGMLTMPNGNHGFGASCPPFCISPTQARDILGTLLAAVAEYQHVKCVAVVMKDFPVIGTHFVGSPSSTAILPPEQLGAERGFILRRLHNLLFPSGGQEKMEPMGWCCAEGPEVTVGSASDTMHSNTVLLNAAANSLSRKRMMERAERCSAHPTGSLDHYPFFSILCHRTDDEREVTEGGKDEEEYGMAPYLNVHNYYHSNPRYERMERNSSGSQYSEPPGGVAHSCQPSLHYGLKDFNKEKDLLKTYEIALQDSTRALWNTLEAVVTEYNRHEDQFEMRLLR